MNEGERADIAFTCPHCQQRLSIVPGGLCCVNGHRFDRAREGYVNLLPSGRHKSRAAGDDLAMVHARRQFFDAGHYHPLMQAVAEMASIDSPRAILDAGCGEGSYLAACAEVTHASCWGVDIAKPAVRLAAKRFQSHHYAVASTFHLPFEDDQFDAALTVFAPRHFEELFRVVRVGGTVVTASPGPDHLASLRKLLYEQPTAHGEKHHVTPDGERPPERAERVRFELSLEKADALNLLQMTPYWWHAQPGHQASLAQRPLSTVVDVWVTCHRKRP